MSGRGRAGLAGTPVMTGTYAKVEVFPPICRMPILQVAATSFTSGPQGLERVRAWLNAHLTGTGHEDLLTSVLVVTNELATNALAHSRSGRDDGSFAVTLTWDAAAVRVAVSDQGGDDLPELQNAGPGGRVRQ